MLIRPRALLMPTLSIALWACDDDRGLEPAPTTTDTTELAPDTPEEVAGFVVGSVVIDPDNNRTTYVQVVDSLDSGPFDNRNAIELAGNAVLLANDDAVFVGLNEEPTWVRYDVTPELGLRESGRVSFLNYGVSGVGYASTLVDDAHAVTVIVDQAVAVVWNPTTMTIEGEIALGHLQQEGFTLESWTTTAHEGRVYIPGRWADWEGGVIRPGVSLTIVDPFAMTVVGVAEDERCASGGTIAFDEEGYGYVMGDGRTYSIQMYANAAGEPTPENCIIRIPPGETDFEEEFFVTVKSLTGGLESITELGTARQGSGTAFSKMFYPDRLPVDVEPIDFNFWNEAAHKLWTLELGDNPTAREVEGMPFAEVGFTANAMGGRLYAGETTNGRSEVYEIDPDTNAGTKRFEMEGYLFGIHAVSPAL